MNFKKISMFFISLGLLCFLVACSSSSSSSSAAKADDRAVGYKCVDSAGAYAYYVFVNAGTTSRSFTSPDDLTNAACVADADEAGIAAVTSLTGVSKSGATVTLEPQTSAVFKLALK